MIIFSLVSFRIGDERLSLLARFSGVTSSESWPLVDPGDRLPAGLGVLPVTASAYDLPGVTLGFRLGDSSSTSRLPGDITPGDLMRLVLPKGDAGTACVHM